jgi:hypothetical protein
MTETQLDLWRRELDVLWDKTQEAYTIVGPYKDKRQRYDTAQRTYKFRLTEINIGLEYFAFVRDNEYEGTHILIPKERKPDAFSGLSNMG